MLLARRTRLTLRQSETCKFYLCFTGQNFALESTMSERSQAYGPLYTSVLSFLLDLGF